MTSLYYKSVLEGIVYLSSNIGKNTLKIVFSVILLSIFSWGFAFGDEPILITKSVYMDKIDFDGRWSFQTEWKKSSLNTLTYDDGMTIYLRTAHQGEFIYVFVDPVSDIHLDKHSDRALICFSGENNKSNLPNSDDYCFGTTLDVSKTFTYQGGSPFKFTSHFRQIESPENYIAISSVSNEYDRYSKIPHPSYEFRIPTELVGRSSQYGFFLSVYDAYNNKAYLWPQNITINNPFQIPGPNLWGEMISPDKSLPEFNMPIIAFVSTIFLLVLITKFSNKQNLSVFSS